MKKRLIGAEYVLCNFLDGAIYDYEEGCIDNTALIEDCIEALYKIGGCIRDYKERFEKAKKKEGN